MVREQSMPYLSMREQGLGRTGQSVGFRTHRAQASTAEAVSLQLLSHSGWRLQYVHVLRTCTSNEFNSVDALDAISTHM